MHNSCHICKMPIDRQWLEMQDYVRVNSDNNGFVAKALTERCIFCYKSLVELNEKMENEWYQKVLNMMNKKKPLTLLIDLDNVTADLLQKWLMTYNEEHNDTLTKEQILEWNIHKFGKCSPDEFYAIIDRPGYFADLDVIQDSIDVTKRLQIAGNIIYFVTATPHNNTTGGFDKCCWVEKHFPHIGKNNVIQAHHKNMIKGDILFDDSADNLHSFDGIKVVMDYMYNKHAIVDYRVGSWIEFENVVEILRNK